VTGEEMFWEVVEPLYADPAVTRSTMMGLPCVRYQGRFFASFELTFLANLAATNTKAFFDAHRGTYRRELLEPSKAFVVALGHQLRQRVSPRLAAEPRVGASMFRITNDLRFSRGKPPYKTYLDFAFWQGEGGPRTDPALIVRITPEEVHLGAGIFGLDREALGRYRATLRDGLLAGELDEIVDRLMASGAILSDPTRARVSRGFQPDGPGARFAVRDGFHATRRFPRPAASATPEFVPWCADRLEPYGALHHWLVTALTLP
jgi:uncharacterized protein (TIGR02453 family)